MTKKKTTPSTKTTKKTKAAAPKEKVAAKAKTSSAQKEITKPKAEKNPQLGLLRLHPNQPLKREVANQKTQQVPKKKLFQGVTKGEKVR